tara:strand:+ start:74 stop:406 length:333 start_codon:yes stop_codon:yes gene_type:complete
MKKKDSQEVAGPTFPEVGEGVQKEKLRRKMEKVGLNVVENMNTVNERNNKELQKELKKLIVGKKDGGLMEAIRKVDAEKGMKKGGTVKFSTGDLVDVSRGQAGYNFKGIY